MKPRIKVSDVKAYYDKDREYNPNMVVTFEEYCKEVEITHEIVHDIEEWGK